MHGWAISQRIQQISEDVLRVNQGSLYPALHRLEGAGWIDAEWGRSVEHNRQAKFYRLTKTGQRQLRDETAQWPGQTSPPTARCGSPRPRTLKVQSPNSMNWSMVRAWLR